MLANTVFYIVSAVFLTLPRRCSADSGATDPAAAEVTYNCTTAADCASFALDDTYIYCCKAAMCLFTNGDCNMDIIDIALYASTSFVAILLLVTPFVVWMFLTRVLRQQKNEVAPDTKDDSQRKGLNPWQPKVLMEPTSSDFPSYYPRPRDSTAKTISSISVVAFERRRDNPPNMRYELRKEDSSVNSIDIASPNPALDLSLGEFSSKGTPPNVKPQPQPQNAFFSEQSSLDFGSSSAFNNNTSSQIIVEETKDPIHGSPERTVKKMPSISIAAMLRRNEGETHKSPRRQNSLGPDRGKAAGLLEKGTTQGDAVRCSNERLAGWAERARRQCQAGVVPHVAKYGNTSQIVRNVTRKTSLFNPANLLNVSSEGQSPPTHAEPGNLSTGISPMAGGADQSPPLAMCQAQLPPQAHEPRTKRTSSVLLSAANEMMTAAGRKSGIVQRASSITIDEAIAQQKKMGPGLWARIGAMPTIPEGKN